MWQAASPRNAGLLDLGILHSRLLGIICSLSFVPGKLSLAALYFGPVVETMEMEWKKQQVALAKHLWFLIPET